MVCMYDTDYGVTSILKVGWSLALNLLEGSSMVESVAYCCTNNNQSSVFWFQLMAHNSHSYFSETLKEVETKHDI